MRDAQEAEERRLREELEKRDKAIRDEERKIGRGKKALDRERQLREERNQIEEEIKQIERKRLVLNEEKNIAKELAREYREHTNKMLPMQSLQQP